MADFLRHKLETLGQKKTPVRDQTSRFIAIWCSHSLVRSDVNDMGNRATTQGGLRRNVRTLWMGKGTSQSTKGHMVLRALLHKFLGTFYESARRLPKFVEIGFLKVELTRLEVDAVLRRAKYGTNDKDVSYASGITQLTSSNSKSMWSHPTLVRSPFGMGETFTLSADWLTTLESAPELTLENLYRDGVAVGMDIEGAAAGPGLGAMAAGGGTTA